MGDIKENLRFSKSQGQGQNLVKIQDRGRRMKRISTAKPTKTISSEDVVDVFDPMNTTDISLR